MAKNNRKQRRVSTDKRETAREVARMGRQYSEAANVTSRLIMGVERPEVYFRYSIALGALYALPTVIDNFLDDYERMGVDRMLRKERELGKLMKTVKTDLERLLAYARKSEVNSFAATTDAGTAEQWANESCDLACTFSNILSFLFGYCIEESDKWRLDTLTSTMTKLVTEEAARERIRNVSARCLQHLKAAGVPDVETAKERLACITRDLAVLKAAKEQGKSVKMIQTDK